MYFGIRHNQQRRPRAGQVISTLVVDESRQLSWLVRTAQGTNESIFSQLSIETKCSRIIKKEKELGVQQRKPESNVKMSREFSAPSLSGNSSRGPISSKNFHCNTIQKDNTSNSL